MITVRRIMKMDQGWTVPNAKGVKIRRKMRDVYISRVIGYLFGCWFRHQQISQKSPFYPIIKGYLISIKKIHTQYIKSNS